MFGMEHVLALIPTHSQGRYIEPFAGKGNVFYARWWRDGDTYKSYVLNDKYRAYFMRSVRDYSGDFSEHLAVNRSNVDDVFNHYASMPHDDNNHSRNLFENIVVFGGRPFNAPNLTKGYIVRIGSTSGKSIKERVEKAQPILRLPNVEITQDDGIEIIRSAVYGDFLYIDPPYLECGQTAYNNIDHEQLLLELHAATERGVQWVLSGYHSDLYTQWSTNHNIHFTEFQKLRRFTTSDRSNCFATEVLWYNEHLLPNAVKTITALAEK